MHESTNLQTEHGFSVSSGALVLLDHVGYNATWSRLHFYKKAQAMKAVSVSVEEFAAVVFDS